MNTDGIAYLFFYKNYKYFIVHFDLIAASGLRIIVVFTAVSPC
jgi:hypothetical protein